MDIYKTRVHCLLGKEGESNVLWMNSCSDGKETDPKATLLHQVTDLDEDLVKQRTVLGSRLNRDVDRDSQRDVKLYDSCEDLFIFLEQNQAVA